MAYDDAADSLPLSFCIHRSLKLAKNPEFHKRSKHIDTRFLWICETYLNGDLKL